MDFPESNELSDTAISFKNNNLHIRKNSLALDAVFSSTELKKGDIIECCPLLVFTEKEVAFLKYTNLYNYYSLKGKEDAPGVLALGFGAIYNHSFPSNAEYKLDLEKKTFIITSVCTIDANVEITINYNGKFDDNTPVVFTPKNEIYEFSVALF
ncbi:MAG: hypothetical protein JWQ09_4839 [Segetibacter sp.]|nr:hypothetical protein [Segetibacter sp.]